MFCDGRRRSPDGRLLIAGGYGGLSTGNIGIVDTNIFDPATNTWTRAREHEPAALVPVADRAGRRPLRRDQRQHHRPSHWAETPEVYDPATNKWTLLTGVSTSQIHEEEYPFSYLLPNGKVFAMGPEEDVTYTLDVDAQTWTPVGPSGLKNGSSVMYRPGKILYPAAGRHRRRHVAAASTAVLDMTAAALVGRRPRRWPTPGPTTPSPCWPTGKVLAVGGAANSNQQQHITTGVLATEIWNPATQTWSTGASMAAARNYHSTAVLMPDGPVLVAGGGHPNSLSRPRPVQLADLLAAVPRPTGPDPTITGPPRPPRPTARRSRHHP